MGDHGPEDLTIIRCKHCGWTSEELTRSDLREMGIPWWCGDCDKKATLFCTFPPEERDIPWVSAWKQRDGIR
jgi:hypothetical protein